MTENEFLITADELAHKLRVHVETVRRLTRSGRIPSVRVGTATRYRLSEVVAACEQRGEVSDVN